MRNHTSHDIPKPADIMAFRRKLKFSERSLIPQTAGFNPQCYDFYKHINPKIYIFCGK
jgi:hypothetical protein